MRWNSQQDRALRCVNQWLHDPHAPQVFRLFGYAGTGKTTLAKEAVSQAGGRVIFAAPTGKAAHVLTGKGCPARTIHSLIYRSKDGSKSALRELEEQLLARIEHLKTLAALPEEIMKDKTVVEVQAKLKAEREKPVRPFFDLNEDSDAQFAKVLVLDEASMIDCQVGEDICSFGKKILVLGDPAQLPPVAGAGYFTEGVKPDIMLTEVERHDNAILELATQLRNHNHIKVGVYDENVRVVMKGEVGAREALAAEQLLVGRNATRQATNVRMRGLKGRISKYPEYMDRLVCLRNNMEDGLVNGGQWDVMDAQDNSQDEDHMKLLLKERGMDSESKWVTVHSRPFRGENVPWYEKKEANEFDFGDAMTVHKAQGSQWGSVVLFDESFAFKGDWWRWLYTGVTRSSLKLTVVKGM